MKQFGSKNKFQVSSLFNTLSICNYDMRKPIQFIQFMLTVATFFFDI